MTDDKMDICTPEEWTVKLRAQAENSREYRRKLYDMVGLASKKAILDVGCGTGAVTLDMAGLTGGRITAIDKDSGRLEEARRALAHAGNIELMEADATDLPFEDGTFDLVTSSIVLIYIDDPQKAVEEMARVTKPGGYVLAACEPDYEGSIEYPPDPLRELVLEHIKGMGADIRGGRKLKYLFNKAGLRTRVGMDTESDFLCIKDDAVWLEKFNESWWLYEKILKDKGWTEEEVKAHHAKAEEKIKSGLGFHFPVAFWAIGEKR